jgi:hypothetical protein
MNLISQISAVLGNNNVMSFQYRHLTSVFRRTLYDSIGNQLSLIRCIASKVFGEKYEHCPQYTFLKRRLKLNCEEVWRLNIKDINNFHKTVAPNKTSVNKKIGKTPVRLQENAIISDVAVTLFEESQKFIAPEVADGQSILSIVRQASGTLPDEKKKAFIDIAIGRQLESKPGYQKEAIEHRKIIREVKEEFKQKDLKLLNADKSSEFFVCPQGFFQTKRKEALNKSFRKTGQKTCGIGQSIKDFIDIAEKQKLVYLKKAMKSTTLEHWLQCFFTAKTHKDPISLRTIVSEKGTKQGVISSYLQKILKILPIKDPFRLEATDEVRDRLEPLHGKSVKMESFDVVNMFLEMDQTTILDIVRSKICEYGAIQYQNKAEISMEAVIELLETYFKSTVIKDGDEYYTQNKGLMIGSGLGSLIADFYMEAIHADILNEHKDLIEQVKVMLMKFVDDILALTTEGQETLDMLFESYKKFSRTLQFTREKPSPEGMQFLDYWIEDEEGVHWENRTKGDKKLAPYNSHTSNTTKKATAVGIFVKAARTSCNHKVKSSLERNIKRLDDSGANSQFIRSTLKQVQHKTREEEFFNIKSKRKEWDKKKTAVVPYIHNVTNELRKSAAGFGGQVSMKFVPKNKNLPMIFDTINNKPEKECEHSEDFKEYKCEKNVVYSLELECEKKYIGETSVCVLTRLQQHIDNVESKTKTSDDSTSVVYSKISTHTEKCKEVRKCHIKNIEPTIIRKNLKNTVARRLVEGYHIRNDPLNVSKAILDPTPNEIKFMKQRRMI